MMVATAPMEILATHKARAHQDQIHAGILPSTVYLRVSHFLKSGQPVCKSVCTERANGYTCSAPAVSTVSLVRFC
jgi:hypothetical protein